MHCNKISSLAHTVETDSTLLIEFCTSSHSNPHLRGSAQYSSYPLPAPEALTKLLGAGRAPANLRLGHRSREKSPIGDGPALGDLPVNTTITLEKCMAVLGRQRWTSDPEGMLE